MKTTIKSIYKGFTNTARMPYTIAKFECGHSVEMVYINKNANLHAPENWAMHVGAETECADCDRNFATIQKIMAFAKTPEYSHTTLRDMTASKTREWMYFCVYRRDAKSPTQCQLEMSVEQTPETERALRDAGIRFILGPSPGEMAIRQT